MQAPFEALVQSYLDNSVGLAENFLSESLMAHLRNNLLVLDAENKLREAGIGKDAKFVRNTEIRNDKIYWLDRKHNNEHENAFLDLIDEFVHFLNSTCYTSIIGYEFHYALYDEGSFYKRHLDQFKTNQGRAFSVITYLNNDWQQGNGGELCVYHPTHTQTIPPIAGQCVFFKSSELEHEVLLSHTKRLSVTGWLKTN